MTQILQDLQGFNNQRVSVESALSVFYPTLIINQSE